MLSHIKSQTKENVVPDEHLHPTKHVLTLENTRLSRGMQDVELECFTIDLHIIVIDL